MRRDKRKILPPANRAPAPATATPASAAPWFKVTNYAEAGYAEIKLRGYIGMPKVETDWYGEEVETQGAGTLKEFEHELEELGDVKKIQLTIFSEGGDVFTGMAIHNLLSRHPAQKVCVIDGICASAATYPAMACEEIRIPANAWMMIHGSNGCVCGGAEDMRKYADMLDSIDATLVNLYAKRTGQTPEEVRSMIQEETWMDGQTAVDAGFADTVIEPLANLAARAGTLQPTNRAMLAAAPAEVLALFDMSRVSNALAASPSMKPRTPLLNAATETPPAGGGAAPAPAPVAAAAPAPVAAPAPAPAAAPVNAAPAAAPVNMVQLTQEQLNQMVTNAATAAVQAHLTNQAALGAAGVTHAALGGAPSPTAPAPAPAAPVNVVGMTALQLINLGRNNASKTALPISASV